jgi:ABC-type amino acid transport system permease subunit
VPVDLAAVEPQASNRIQSDTFRSFETYIVVGLVYLALSFVVRWAFCEQIEEASIRSTYWLTSAG